MKKTSLTIIMAVACYFTYAQNTYPFPSSGSVGVGTTSPSQLFDVTGTTGSFSSTAKANADFIQDHTNYRGVIMGYDAAGQIGIVGGASAGTQSNLAFWNVGSGGWFEAMRLTSNGYLGIGTTAPLAPLQVVGTLLTSGSTANIDPNQSNMTLNFLNSSANMLIGWNRTSGSGETDFIANQGAGGMGGFAFYNHNNSGIEKQLMWIMGTGNVLIGKTGQANSSYMLDVAGNVRANQITVNTNGADFVFEPTYHLIPLSALKTYLDQNHHLPDIVSAKEMQTDGLNLGENQTKLLQKVEELTLYLIEEENKEKKQADKIAQLEQNAAATSDKLKELDAMKQQLQQLINQQSIKK